MVFNLDTFIDKHLHANQFKDRKRLTYKVEDLHELCNMSTELFQKEPSLVRMNPPCIIVGDIHGQYFDLLRMFSLYKVKGESSGALNRKFVFVGDYVDRGANSLECMCLVLALKNRFPGKYLVLRGNHECESISSVYGFKKELIDRLGGKDGKEVYDHFIEMFSWMPLAGLVGERILCMHGGISPELRTLQDIEKIERPITEVSVGSRLALDLLWADPQEGIEGYRHNTLRDVSVFFGEDEVYRVCKDLDIRLIVRGHQMMSSGFGSFANRKLVTIFTAPRYQKGDPNAGATMEVDARGRIGIHILDPSGDFSPDDEEETKKDSGLDLLSPIKKKPDDEKSVNAKKADDAKKSDEPKKSDDFKKSYYAKKSEDGNKSKHSTISKEKKEKDSKALKNSQAKKSEDGKKSKGSKVTTNSKHHKVK